MGRQNRRRKTRVPSADPVKKTELVVETTAPASSAEISATTTVAMITTEEDEKFYAKRVEAYWKLREELMKRQLSNTENFDKSILTLSSAALALGVTFLRDHMHGDGFGLLLWSWILHVTAIISTLISYLVSLKGLDKQLTRFEGYYLENKEEALDGKNWPDRVNGWLAYVSAGTFTLGIILMLIYFGMNPPNAKGVTDVRQNQPIATPATKSVQGMGAKAPGMVPITRAVAPSPPPTQSQSPQSNPPSNGNGNAGK